MKKNRDFPHSFEYIGIYILHFLMFTVKACYKLAFVQADPELFSQSVHLGTTN